MALREDVRSRFPAPDSGQASEIRGFGSHLNFPDRLARFNDLTLHPRLLTPISQFLGVPVADLRLTQADLWPKYGRDEEPDNPLDNTDQRIHDDYPNHTLVHPAPWTRPEAVEMIVYLSDVNECGGPTAVVAREGDSDPAYSWPIVDTPGVGDLDYVNDRSRAEAYPGVHITRTSTLRDF